MTTRDVTRRCVCVCVRTVGAEALGDLEPALVPHVDVAVVLMLRVVQHRVLLHFVY